MFFNLGSKEFSEYNSKHLIPKKILLENYGEYASEIILPEFKDSFVLSQYRDFDLIELEQLLQSVGWGRRPLRRVKRALENSILKVGLWQHDQKFPRLIGFARCTGDGIIDATVWDVAIQPVYQGSGLGRRLMTYLIKRLKNIGVKRVTLFADANVISFYRNQGWILEPKGCKCAFWYSN